MYRRLNPSLGLAAMVAFGGIWSALQAEAAGYRACPRLARWHTGAGTHGSSQPIYDIVRLPTERPGAERSYCAARRDARVLAQHPAAIPPTTTVLSAFRADLASPGIEEFGVHEQESEGDGSSLSGASSSGSGYSDMTFVEFGSLSRLARIP